MVKGGALQNSLNLVRLGNIRGNGVILAGNPTYRGDTLSYRAIPRRPIRRCVFRETSHVSRAAEFPRHGAHWPPSLLYRCGIPGP